MIFWILTTARSGSNYVTGEIWRRLGGRPKGMEYLSEWGIGQHPDFVPDPAAPVRSRLEYLLAREALDGVLAVKILWHHVEACCRYPDFLDQLAGRKIVYLRRRDAIRQGISLYLAKETDAWSSWSSDLRRPPEEVPYDHAAIRKAVQRTERHDASLRTFLETFGLEHLTVHYEDFVAAPEVQADRVLGHLGLPRASGPLAISRGFESQHSAVNEQFRERFLADERARLRGDGAYRGPPIFPEIVPPG